MAGNLTFRLFQPDDIAGVLRLWNDNSRWGSITEQQFYDWYINTPYGECPIVLAADEENRIVGQEVFTPSRIYVDGAEKKALRLSAPILAKELRERMKNDAHPIAEMYKMGVKTAVENGYAALYAFPAAAWLPVFQLLLRQVGWNDFVTAEYNCCSLSLDSISIKNLEADNNIKVSLASSITEEYDRLWQAAKNNFPINCAIIRNSNWLRWKLGGHRLLEVRREKDGDLVGYAAIKKDSGLLVDALARTPQDLETTLTAIIKTLAESSDLKGEKPIEEIKLMETAALRPAIEKLGFDRKNFKFAFWCYSFDESVPIQTLEPARWYMMPDD